MSGWTDAATKGLLAIWGEHNIQKQLDKVKRNKHIYQKVSEKLAQNGHHFSAKQCRTKVKSMQQSYKKIKDHNRTSGQDAKTCPWYKELNEILGTRVASEPPLVVQTRCTPRSAPTEVTQDDQDDLEDESTEPPQSPVLTRPSTVNTSDEEDLDDTDINASSSSVSTTHDQEPGPSQTTTSTSRSVVGTKRSSGHGNDLIAKLIGIQEEADKKEVEREDRRLRQEAEFREREK